jgi:hypothetical protein
MLLLLHTVRHLVVKITRMCAIYSPGFADRIVRTAPAYDPFGSLQPIRRRDMDRKGQIEGGTLRRLPVEASLRSTISGMAQAHIRDRRSSDIVPTL